MIFKFQIYVCTELGMIYTTLYTYVRYHDGGTRAAAVARAREEAIEVYMRS